MTIEVKPPLDFPYFPTRWQLVLWRNWGLVGMKKLAGILECSDKELKVAAVELGLPAVPVEQLWLKRSYITVIRNNWHLLNTDQILALLGWEKDQLNTVFQEDFLWGKLGGFKPVCPVVKYAPLFPEEQARTNEIREIAQQYFARQRTERIFSFEDKYEVPDIPLVPGRFAFNFIHPYTAGTGDVFVDIDHPDPAPEKLLAAYSKLGVKGIWLHAVLYALIPIPGAEEFSPGHEKRMRNLAKLARRCSKHGIGLYLYLNEPRGMTEDFYRKMPNWKGPHKTGSLNYCNCLIHTKEPLNYLEYASFEVFRRVPELAGAFLITMSESPTHCKSVVRDEECPYCRDFSKADLVMKVLDAVEYGVHRASPEARVIASDWAWGTVEERKVMIDRLPEKIIYMSISEWGKKTNVGGIPGKVVDYSISQVGPSEETREVLAYAKQRGRKTLAKVQINNSWELSAVPFLAVPYMIREHLDNLHRLGVDGLMLSWTLGGYPGGNLLLLDHTVEDICPDAATRTAWRKFSEAFREFPFNIHVIYNAPMNAGPRTMFHLKPTGYEATMVGFPYDDLNTWRAIYPEDVFENQFAKLVAGWEEGLRLLPSPPFIEEAAYCHFASTLNQIRFVRARNTKNREGMQAAVANEQKIAVRLYEVARRDSRIGYEASNHYYYTLNDLVEKIVNCDYVLKELRKKNGFTL